MRNTIAERATPQTFDRLLSSMCTAPHPAARDAAERFLATNPGDPGTYPTISALEDEAVETLGEIAGSVDALFHVDAAWGGFVLPFTDAEWHFGHAAVDTMAIDPHKMGQAAVPAGGLLARSDALLDELAVDTPYLESTAQATLTGTRSGAGVASAVAAMEALWPDGYRDQYVRSQRNAEWLADALEKRGYDVVEPTLTLVAADVPRSTFDALRDEGWRISRTATDEMRIVCMPHVTREMLASFIADLDRLEVRASVPVVSDD